MLGIGPLLEGAGCACEGCTGASGSEKALGLRAGNTVSTQASINAPGEDGGSANFNGWRPARESLSGNGTERHFIRACCSMHGPFPFFLYRPAV